MVWRNDPIILDRVRVGMTSWLEGRTLQESRRLVNAFLAERWPDEKSVSEATIVADRKRGVDLRRESVVEPLQHHLAELDHAIDTAYGSFRAAKPDNPNRGAQVGNVGRLIELKAKLDGSLQPERLVIAMVAQQADKIEEVFMRALADAEWCLTTEQVRIGREALGRAIAGTTGVPRISAHVIDE